MFVRIHKIVRKLIIVSALFFSTFFLFISYFLFGFHVERPLSPRISFWMEHDWIEGKKDFYEIKRKIENNNITDLYFHVGPIDPDGSLPDDLIIFSQGLDAINTVNYAWLGQIRSDIDLDDMAVRAKIIESAQMLIKNGFNGIHFDIEPIKEDDEGFFLLLEELRAAGSEFKISVAIDEWQPHLFSRILAWYFETDIESYWTANQIQRASQYADQIVVMTYDTGFHDPDLFTWWVEQQTVALSNIVPEELEVFIGIPSYSIGKNFDPNAENISSSIQGFIKGYQNFRTEESNLDGIAIYSYWEMDDTEWLELNNLNLEE